MAPRPQPYRLQWPLTPSQVENIDTMFESLFKIVRNGSIAVSVSQVSGVIDPTQGGTGLTSYVKGDILYASETNVVGKLPDVATGNALISGGVAAAPSWGKIGLTTHVTGTLPIASGGTGQITAAAAFDALSPLTTRGDIAYRNATTVTRLPAGTSGQFLKTLGSAADPVWATVSVDDIPLASDRALYWTSLDNTNFNGAAAPGRWDQAWASAVSAGGSGIKDTSGYWYRMGNTAAGTGSETHLNAPTLPWVNADMLFRQRWTFRPTAASNYIMLFVLIDSNTLIAYDGAGLSANNARKGFGVRLDDATGFTGWYSDGVTAAITSVFAAVAQNGIYTVEVAQLVAGTIQVSVNGVTQTFAAPAITTQQLVGVMNIFTKTGAKSFDWKATYGERT